MHYTILGGGIAGLTSAIALKKIGIEATVFEAAATIKPVGAGLVLAANAIKAYRRLGMAEKIIAKGQLLPTFKILRQNGKVLTSADARAIGQKYDLHNFAIHRAALHETLLTAISPEQVITSKKAVGFDHRSGGKIEVLFADGSTHLTDFLIVADGIHSAIRQQLLPDSKPRYAGYTCWRAVIENPGLALDAATETWGSKGRMGIVPLADNKIYFFACVNAPEQDPISRAYQVTDLQRIFQDFHDPIPTILQHTKDSDLIWNDIIDLKPIGQFAFNNIVLIGDAAHATTPNLGQGACQAIEDAVILAEELTKHMVPATAFAAFEKRRIPRTHYVVNTSWNLGRVAQWSNPWLAALRDTMFQLIPERTNEKQLKRLLEVDF
ncbi:MAG: FAD-dependent monooxygenase [Saprospiraceae bacterium]